MKISCKNIHIIFTKVVKEAIFPESLALGFPSDPLFQANEKASFFKGLPKQVGPTPESDSILNLILVYGLRFYINKFQYHLYSNILCPKN